MGQSAQIQPDRKQCICPSWLDVGSLGCTSSTPVSYVGLWAQGSGVVNHCLKDLMSLLVRRDLSTWLKVMVLGEFQTLHQLSSVCSLLNMQMN